MSYTITLKHIVTDNLKSTDLLRMKIYRPTPISYSKLKLHSLFTKLY